MLIQFPSCFLFADNYTEIRFISHFYLMLTKRQLFLILLAVLSVLIAAGTLFYMRKIEQQLREPMPGMIYQPEANFQTENSASQQDANPLQQDFDTLLSGESLSDMYEGVEEYGFTGSQN